MKAPQRVELSETVESEQLCFYRKTRVTEPHSPKWVLVPELLLPVVTMRALKPALPVVGPPPGPSLPRISAQPQAPEFELLEPRL